MRPLKQLLQQTRRLPHTPPAADSAGEHPNFWMY